jgi:hypothetical protein
LKILEIRISEICIFEVLYVNSILKKDYAPIKGDNIKNK